VLGIDARRNQRGGPPDSRDSRRGRAIVFVEHVMRAAMALADLGSCSTKGA
jgi:hypothetical protein